MKEFLIYMAICVVMLIGQTWWYPKHLGWAHTLAIWLVGGIIAAVLASIIRSLPFRQERKSDIIALVAAMLATAAVIGLTRGMWIIQKL